MSNRSDGNKFERVFCDMLRGQGFWVHNMIQSTSGQPADVLAVKNTKAFLIDCKVCSDGEFRYSRVEPNQHTAMDFWAESGNGEGWFALLMPDETVRMLPYTNITGTASMGHKAIKGDMLDALTIPFKAWADYCEPLIIPTDFRPEYPTE